MIVGPASSGLLYEIDPAVPYVAAAIGAALRRHRHARRPLSPPAGAHAVGADADVAPRPRRSALRPPPTDPARGDLPRPVRRVVRRGRRAAAGDRRGPSARRQHRLRLAARRAGRRRGHRVGTVGGAPGAPARRHGAVHRRRRLRCDDGRSRRRPARTSSPSLALVVLAAADSISVFIRATLVPLATPDHMRGRVSAVENVFIGASNELGAFESGVAAALLGVGPAVVLGGVATMAVVGAVDSVVPRAAPRRHVRRCHRGRSRAAVAMPTRIADTSLARTRTALVSCSTRGRRADPQDRRPDDHEEAVRRVPGFHQPGQRRSPSPSAW